MLATATATKNSEPDRPAGSVSPPENERQDTASDPVVATPDFWVEVCQNSEQLQGHLTGWNDLIGQTLESNVFYEPWWLLESLKTFHTQASLRIVVVYRKNKRVTDPPILCGLFPLEVVPGQLPGLARLRLLTNMYSYLASPLLHRQYAQEALGTLLDWARSERYSLLEMPRLNGSGPVHQAIVDLCYERQITPFAVEKYNRAVLLRAENYEAYQAGNLRGHNRRDMNRLRRRLEEQGQLEFRLLESTNHLNYWIDSFLHLEQQGWKGEQGTALNQAEEHAEFFRSVLCGAWEAGQLQMMGMFLNGDPIALKCNLLSAPGSFAWKIAYDEKYARFSPGVQLEQENIQIFHEQTSLEWMDSCAVAAHSMINRLWCDRRTITHLLLPTGTKTGEFYTALRPLLRFFKQWLKGTRGQRKRVG